MCFPSYCLVRFFSLPFYTVGLLSGLALSWPLPSVTFHNPGSNSGILLSLLSAFRFHSGDVSVLGKVPPAFICSALLRNVHPPPPRLFCREEESELRGVLGWSDEM